MATNVVLVLGLVILGVVIIIWPILNVLKLFQFATDRYQSSHTDW